MTTVACGKCGRPGLMCQCPTEPARGSLFGIPAGGFAKWDPQKISAEPLTLKRLHDGIRPWVDPQAEMRAGAAAVGDAG